jgi:mono/diheme cytochrome c family protein
MSRRLRLAVAGGAVVLAAAFALFWLLRPTPQAADADDAALVAHGRALYREHCTSCHGTNLEGQPNWHERLPNGRLPAPPHDESGHTWHHPDDLLFALIKQGPAALAGGAYESDMPAYAGVLSDADIRAVIAFIKSTWPAHIHEKRAGMKH